jgi:predicted phage terminase large subunit-like protein
MYQQRPAPAKGAIFDSGWWRFWTSNQSRETADGRVVYLDPSAIVGGEWLDSWDMAFKGVSDSDWVVGQRWVRHRANRFLVAQVRGRWSFTQSIAAMKRWAVTDNPFSSPCGHLVHERLVEEKANGVAIIDTLKNEITGLKPINPVTGKEARARAITPEVESGNVYLPHPGDPGNEWVTDLLSELRNFPHDTSDDQVDALTQALNKLRIGARGQVTVPGSDKVIGPAGGWSAALANRSIARTAKTDLARRRATQ